jgi:hypothetical protein
MTYRKALGQAWAKANDTYGQPTVVAFWTIPAGTNPYDPLFAPAAYPFDFGSYYLQTIASSARINPDYKPWAVIVIGSGLKENLKARLYDNQVRWEGDITTHLSGDKTWLSFQLPRNVPPSNCNIGKTCTIKISLFDPGINIESNKIDLTLPATTQPEAIFGDLNEDGKIDIFDFNILVTDFGNPYTISDYNDLVENFRS